MDRERILAAFLGRTQRPATKSNVRRFASDQDVRRQRVEKCLGAFIIQLEALAGRIKQERAERDGRFPIRVGLDALMQADVIRVLTEPENALIRQYTVLLATENVALVFRDEAIAELARIAALVNERTENIGARRLHTVMERLLDEISFDAPEMGGREVVIDAAYVRERLNPILQDQDLSRYILQAAWGREVDDGERLAPVRAA